MCNVINPAECNVVTLFILVLQARDPSVHAAILAHLNQKYGSGSSGDPSSAEKNKLVSRTSTKRCSQSFDIKDVWTVNAEVFTFSLVCQCQNPGCDPVQSNMSCKQETACLLRQL